MKYTLIIIISFHFNKEINLSKSHDSIKDEKKGIDFYLWIIFAIKSANSSPSCALNRSIILLRSNARLTENKVEKL